uniref:Uncharacterized protein n=1 Tax=Octopus bimaculoides TaxID=37653 RepID=A0A0L8GD56_OCTBM
MFLGNLDSRLQKKARFEAKININQTSLKHTIITYTHTQYYSHTHAQERRTHTHETIKSHIHIPDCTHETHTHIHT